MKDFLGHTLKVDDSVVLMLPGYRDLVKGKITGFTKMYVKVSFNDYYGKEMSIRQLPKQLVKFIQN